METLETLRDSLQLEVDNSAHLLKQKDRDIKTKALQVQKFQNFDVFMRDLSNVSLVMRKPVFGVCDQVRHKRACAATEAS